MYLSDCYSMLDQSGACASYLREALNLSPTKWAALYGR